ncbi:DUF4232 domain-containing protein [Actinospica sp.]|jgi:hypothetical protein|uniref:DUF4232 domain-containing protein n=1 Tax=Actinospica sp. TaxID=1872142 RepID=UPI002C99C479|nr:DUF4232 domain-containing protein [Actinospica sp.]HWG25406.1 DUF4232 domain-containing protein [Actinospica sp.]
MTAPFDPRDRDDEENTEHNLFDDPNSMTWGTADPDFDAMLRERLGPMPAMPTPPYAFERVLVAGRRRRARKVWAGAAAAAFVVMAGTAGTTVALNTGSPSGGTAIGEAQSGTSSPSATVTSQSPSAVPTPIATPTPSATATGTNTPVSATSATASPSSSVPQCASDMFTLSVSTAPGSSGSTADQLIIVLTNTSGHDCTTYGYPGLQLETQSGQLQSTTVTRLDKSAVKHLTVPPNDSISTTATFTAATGGATSSTGCGMASYSLAVIPPNNEQQITQTINGGPITVCGNGVLDTTPLVLGSNGS